MLKTFLVLPDGTVLRSGDPNGNGIRSFSYRESVNVDTELTPGSIFSSVLEAMLYTEGGNLNIAAGEEIELWRVSETNVQTLFGPYALEKPTRPSQNSYKITAYDRTIRLDKDLSAWVESLTGWPYSLLTLAQMVCQECGLTLVNTELPNGDFPVWRFYSSGVTGRQIMRWIGELAGRFCRATPQGEIEFAWYEDSDVEISPSGSWGYFAGSLKYEDYTVAPIDAVQLRLANSDSGALWPEVDAGSNSYIITGNRLITVINDEILPYLQVLQREISGLSYTPCTVAVAASTDLRAGHKVKVTDRNGKTFSTCVMSRSQRGQRDTLECTGSYRRNSATAVSGQPRDPAGDALGRLSREEIFNKLTQNGKFQGLYIDPETGEIYVNASYIKSGEFLADLIKAGVLKSNDDGKTFLLDLDKGTFHMEGSGKFVSLDGKTYLTVEGNRIILFSNRDTDEPVEKLTIGFLTGRDPDNTEDVDYPYILLGNSGTDVGQAGLVKKFWDGVFIGNSAARDAYGRFSPAVDWAGFFINTVTGKSYVVQDGYMKDVYLDDPIARFA